MLSTFIAQYLNNPALNIKVGNAGGNQARGPEILTLFFKNFVNLAFGFGGLYFFVQILRSGYDWINAGGDKEAVQKARARLTNAITGVVLLFSVFMIIFIVETVFGISIRTFNLPNL